MYVCMHVCGRVAFTPRHTYIPEEEGKGGYDYSTRTPVRFTFYVGR